MVCKRKLSSHLNHRNLESKRSDSNRLRTIEFRWPHRATKVNTRRKCKKRDSLSQSEAWLLETRRADLSSSMPFLCKLATHRENEANRLREFRSSSLALQSSGSCRKKHPKQQHLWLQHPRNSIYCSVRRNRLHLV